jgi:drug/metabolite transporter (DMT)-like permease
MPAGALVLVLADAPQRRGTWMLWIAATLAGAVGQTARNAAQSGLTRSIGTLGATQVRFLFGLPFAVLFLAVVTLITHQTPPLPGGTALAYTAAGAAAQILGTALMLITMKSQNFAVTTAWLKTEPVLVALVSWVVMGEVLGWSALAAIALATSGVLVMTVKPGALPWKDARAAVSGLGAAAMLGASAICFRGGILALPLGDFRIRATTTLVLSLALQTGILLIWMAFLDRRALAASFGVWRASLLAGLLGAAASQFWFIGFALTSAANVRTLALVEVVLAQGISVFWLRQKASSRQVVGMVIVVFGVAALLRLQAG